MSDATRRTEHDSLGSVTLPASARYGAQTQRAIDNFRISDLRIPRGLIEGLGLIKGAAAHVNAQLELLAVDKAGAIEASADAVANGEHDAQFPVDVFQTGSGTSWNMNANEVIANLASERLGRPVHSNDHVNLGQSSNDTIPSAIHLAATLALQRTLIPALDHLRDTIYRRANDYSDLVKTGRTHLMDAMPLTVGQEFSGWGCQVRLASERLRGTLMRISTLAQGGTAIGTGINAHPKFGARVCERLSERTGIEFASNLNFFEALGAQDASVELSGQLKVVAVSLMKIANDLRWMNSGPLAGLGEISLPALQPGSSIMPGKVNPVIPEAVAMVGAQVIGNDATITVAGQSGNFQLNVMLPVIGYNLLQSIELLANAATALADLAIAGLRINEKTLARSVERNPMLVTALNRIIGYERGARIAKRAYAEGRPLIDVACEETDLAREELQRLLDPKSLTRGGIKK